MESRGPHLFRQQGFEARWRRRFQDFAARFEDDAGIAGWSPTGLAARLRHFGHWWGGAPPGTLWLDAGCGAGTYTRFLAGQGLTVLGMDYSLPTLVKAKARGGGLWAAGEVARLPVRPGSLDGVLCFGVIQALSESGPAVGELAAALRPGGQVWIDALNAWCLPHLGERLMRRLRKRPPHVRYESPRVLAKLLRRNGLEHVRLYWLPILPARWQRLQWLAETEPARWLFRAAPLLGALLSHSFVLSAERRR
jgi:SAM-dependent methyltransferase